MQKYQEQLNTNNFYLQDNENLKTSYQNLQAAFDSFKVQSKSNETLMEDLNNQVFFFNLIFNLI